MLDLMCSTVYIKSNMQKDVIRQFKIGLLKQIYNQISLMSEFSIKNFDSFSLENLQ
jgi:hypothetical protein